VIFEVVHCIPMIIIQQDSSLSNILIDILFHTNPS